MYSVVNANRALWLLAAFACIAGCGPKNDASTEILVFAAASLADVMTEVEEAFERQSDVKVDISYGGSQLLAQQIASGAPADIFVSAGRFPVDFLKERGLLEPGWSSLLTNKLVVTSPTSGGAGVTSLAELAAPEVRRIAIANPKLAPAGRYAQESLTQLGLWDRLQPKLVFASDVRATLAFVEAGKRRRRDRIRHRRQACPERYYIGHRTPGQLLAHRLSGGGCSEKPGQGCGTGFRGLPERRRGGADIR